MIRWEVTANNQKFYGPPEQIVAQMAAMEHPGTRGVSYMARVKRRVKVVYGKALRYKDPASFLMALERANLISIKKQ